MPMCEDNDPLCTDILDQRITYQMTSGYRRIPHHNEHDKPILDAINIYWQDFLRLAEKRHTVRAEMLKMGDALGRIQKRREQFNIASESL